MSNVLGIEQREFEELCKEVLDRMTRHVGEFVTPISRRTDQERGYALGTGNYVQLGKSVYLVTNEHVYAGAEGDPLGHLPGPTNEYIHCCHHFQVAGDPLDIAIMRLGQECKNSDKAVVQAFQIGDIFDPVPGELMYLLGFPGSTATRQELVTELNVRCTWFGQPIENLGIPVLTQVNTNSLVDVPGYDPMYHTAVHFPSKARRIPGGPEEDLPNPKGMSGSLLWDTRLVANYNAGEDWHPENARVCGIIWGQYTKPEILMATKIDHLRPVLLRFLREEAAYYHWIDRKRPEGEPMVDWRKAEDTITSL